VSELDRAEGPVSARRSRVFGVFALVLAAALLVLAVYSLSRSGDDGALVGPAGSAIVAALVAVLIAVIAFRVGRGGAGARAQTGPLTLFTILAFVLGVAGAGLGILFGLVSGSGGAISTGLAVFALALLVAVQGALVYRVAARAN